MFKFLLMLMVVALFVASCGSDGTAACTEANGFCYSGDPADPEPKSGEVEVIREGMWSSCSLSVSNNHLAWTESTQGDSALNCLEYGGPIYRMDVTPGSSRTPWMVGEGISPSVNEVGRVGHIEIDLFSRCARAKVDDRAIVDNCDAVSSMPQLASTSFSGDNFAFTLLKNSTESRLYKYDARTQDVRAYDRNAFMVEVRGSELGFIETTREDGGTPYQRGRIVNSDQYPMLDFGYSAGSFSFSAQWVIYAAWENDGTGAFRGNAYLMNRVNFSGYQVGPSGRVAMHKEGTHFAWESNQGLRYSRIGVGAVASGPIIGGRNPVFDGKWLYYIAPSPVGEALYRLSL